jgi:hypothetical protein
MFGYDSDLAKKGQQQANQATANRQALMEKLQQEVKNQAWKKVKPSWQPKKMQRADFNINAEIKKIQNQRAAEAAAQRQHELAMARAKALAESRKPAAPGPQERWTGYQGGTFSSRGSALNSYPSDYGAATGSPLSGASMRPSPVRQVWDESKKRWMNAATRI